MEHLTSLPTRTVGALSSVSAFNHERVPMSCLQQLDAPEANNWMNKKHLRFCFASQTPRVCSVSHAKQALN